MQTLYTVEKIQELLTEVDADGIAVNKWAEDGSAIIKKSAKELKDELHGKKLLEKNEHGIPVNKLENDKIVKRSKAEIDADEAVYNSLENRVNRFNSFIAVGACYTLSHLLSTKDKRAAWGPLADMIRYKQFAGIKNYGTMLITEGTISLAEFTEINDTVFKPQAIDLNEF